MADVIVPLTGWGRDGWGDLGWNEGSVTNSGAAGGVRDRDWETQS